MLFELLNISFDDDMVEIIFSMAFGSCVNTYEGWLEFLLIYTGILLTFIYSLYEFVFKLNWIYKKFTTCKFILMVIDSPRFLKISIICFRFLSILGPGNSFVIPNPSSL